MEVAAVEKYNSLSVSISVMLILYSLIMPFQLAIGGGSQARKIESGLTAVDARFRGGLVGAGIKWDVLDTCFNSSCISSKTLQ